jgi:uroporphyrinogen-III synthase
LSSCAPNRGPVESGAGLGLDAYAFPLFETQPRTWDAPAPDTFDALLLGSANVMRHGGPDLALYAGKPAYCVGKPPRRWPLNMGLRWPRWGQAGFRM